MKFFFLVVVTWCLLPLQAQVNNYQVGDIVNDFTVVDTQGNQYSLYSLTAQGKYVYLDFFYTACASCQSKISIFNEFWDKYGCGDYDIFCLAINQGMDNNLYVENFENTFGGSFHHAPAIASEGGAVAVTADFGVNVFSTFCIIAPGNKLIVADINPMEAVKNLEDALTGFTLNPMPCSTSLSDVYSEQATVTIEARNLQVSFPVPQKFSLALYDTTGKQLFSGHYFTALQSYDLSAFPPGIYLLQILYDGQIQHMKFIISL